MQDIAIHADNLGKQYRIGGHDHYKALRDSVTEALYAPFRRFRGSMTPCGQDRPHANNMIWALKEASFEVRQGEVVGVIGRNGAGKSTLLKILSRVTPPTEGRVTLYGRVGSLLEVGTGFHPELTGRENIYLNGAILGMRKAEIERKFDEIVAFAEVEKFIETPVRHYSSGMSVRLAFAVAAHLETDLLFLDEVLAVGDAAFQKKCLGKMGDIAKGGRTILSVSHQLNQIRRYCTRCIWFDGGRIRQDGRAAAVLSAYEAALTTGSAGDEDRERQDHKPDVTRFLRWEVAASSPAQPNVLDSSGPCTFKFALYVSREITHGHHGIALWNNEGQLMWAWATDNLRLPSGYHEFSHTLPMLPLRPGVYRWQVSLFDDRRLLDNWHCTPELLLTTEPQGHQHDEWSGILNVAPTFDVVDKR